MNSFLHIIAKQCTALCLMLALIGLFGMALLNSADATRQAAANPDSFVAHLKNLKALKHKKAKAVSSGTVAQALLSPNSRQEDTLPVIHKSGTLTTNETWTAGNVYVIDSVVTILNGVTLTLDPGTIVKDGSGNTSIYVSAGGTLNASGSSIYPVIFTSIQDDSVGGDTNQNGPSTGSVGDYSLAVNAAGGNVYISNTIIQNVWVAFSKTSSGTAELTDNVLKGQVYIRNYPTTLQRNQFNVPTNVGAALSVQYVSDLTGIALSGTDANTFSGSGRSRAIELLDDSIASGTSWQVSPATNAVLSVGSLTVNGTLTFDPGVIVKNGDGNTSISVSSGGTLNASGTITSPIIFTSSHDDSAGGDTDNNGIGVGSRGDYNSAVEGKAGSALAMSNVSVSYASEAYILKGQTDLNDVTVDHVSLAFNIYDGDANLLGISIDEAQNGVYVTNAAVIFRGTLSGISNKGIQACDWNSTSCSVDASYTDWGSTGPTSSLVCGQVTVAPWKTGSTTVNGGLFASQNCNGSPSPDQQLNTTTTNYSDRMSIKDIDCSNGFQDACDAMQTAQQCLSAATTLAASTSSFPLPSGNAYEQPAQWGGMLADNASTYIQSQEGEIPILSAASFGTQLLGAVQTIMNVATAYNTCAP